MKLILIIILHCSVLSFGQIRLTDNKLGKIFINNDINLVDDSMYVRFISPQSISYTKIPIGYDFDLPVNLYKHSENVTSLYLNSHYGSFAHYCHYYNSTYTQGNFQNLDIFSYNFRNSKNLKKTLQIDNSNYTKSLLNGPIDYIASPAFEAGDSIVVISSDGESKMQTIVVLDKDFNILDLWSFQSKSETVKFREGLYSNGFCYLVLNEFLDRTNPQSPTNTIILKIDLNSNLVETKIIQDFNTYKFEVDNLGNFIFSGRRVSDGNLNILKLDNSLNYLLGLQGKDIKDIVNTSSPLFITFGFEKLSGVGNCYYFNTKSKFGYSVLSKFDNNFQMQWQKVIPGYFDFIPYKFGGGYVGLRKSEFLNNFQDLYYIDQNGSSISEFSNYCGISLEPSNYYLDKIISIDNIEKISRPSYSETNFQIQNNIESFILDSLNFLNVIPQPEFKANDEWCINTCDTLHSLDIGLIDSSYFVFNNMLGDSIFCPTMTGDIDIWYYITYYGGCQDSVMKTIHVDEPPTISLVDSTILCDENAGVEVSAAATGISFWNNDPSNNNLTKTFFKSGYQTLTSNVGLCKTTDSIYISSISDLIEGWPNILDTESALECEGTSVQISLKNPSQYESISWSNGTSNSSIEIDAPGVYSVEVESLGCLIEDSAEVLFKDCRQAEIFVPNAFSPNFDGINDQLHINYINAEILDFGIYSRWGELVYQEKPYNDIGWDGSFKGLYVNPGVYVWMIKYLNKITGKVEVIKGDVSIIL